MTINPHDGPRPQTGRSHSSSFGTIGTNGRGHSSSISKNSYSKASSETPPKSSKSNKTFKPDSRPPTSNTTRSQPTAGARLRTNAPQPRDARVDRESIGDFAEFIKSTGPVNYEAPAPAPPRTATSNGHRGTNSLSKTTSGTRVNAANSLPRRAESSAGRSRLQARDAVVPRGDSISDLIDFVRNGPQLETNSHRIPRTVPPFRTTIDSDVMSGAVGGRAVDASLPDPRYSQTASVDSSINSQSALLNSSRNKPAPARLDFDEEDEDMPMPKRKTRRVRDMYQIDYSDEEEEYEAMMSSGPRRPAPVEEESLADFLKNVPPPPDSSPAPLLNLAPAAAAKKIKKKSSTPGLMSRFGRRDSEPRQPPKPKSSGRDAPPVSRSQAPQLPTHSQSVSYGPSKPAAYQPARGPVSNGGPVRSGNGNNYDTQVDSARSKVVQKSYQPREAVYTGGSSATSDLASFLKNSEPPPPSAPQPFMLQSAQKEKSGFSQMFGRKKTVH